MVYLALDKYIFMPLIPKKIVSTFLALAIVALELFNFPVAHAAVKVVDNVAKEVEYNNLVAVVVDTQLDKNLNSYVGLRGKYPNELKSSTIGERVVRYANDLRQDNEQTDVRVIFFDSSKDDVKSLASAFENLYLNEHLVGVVIVGNIPLPVVNKNGNKFVSMYPYTDFEDKAFLYNEETQDYEINPSVTFPKPEIWHGVIDGNQNDLAEYFDKNHLYYAGVPEYSKFEKRLFYGDLVHEESNLNEDAYKYYVDSIKYMEDLAYMRYGKEWAQKVSGKILDNLPINKENPEAVKYLENLKKGDFGTLPDIQTKQIIDQYLIPYFQLFSYYLSQVNDLTYNTGRYDLSEVDTPVSLISMKDEFTKQYLKNVNSALENQINQIAEIISEPVPLLRSAKLGGYFADKSGQKESFKVEYQGSVVDLVMRFNYLDEENNRFYVKGIQADTLENVKQCGLYLGTTKLTKSSRVSDNSTAFPKYSIGVNTRILSPEEALKLTKSQSSFGAVIEDNPKYGISAFIDNPYYLYDKYKNPLVDFMKKGDVIVSINGKQVNSSNSVENIINSEVSDVRSDSSLVSNKIQFKTSNLSFEYYRGTSKKNTTLSFMVASGGYLLKDYYTGGENSKMIGSSNGVVFELYNSRLGGYGYKGYDQSAGCNQNSSEKYPARCFEEVARMPVLDPAGSVVSKINGDVDEYYLNSCFEGLMGVSDLSKDSNYSLSVLDGTLDGNNLEQKQSIDVDFYGRFLDRITAFISGSGKYPESDMQDEFLLSNAKSDPANIVISRSGEKLLTLKDFSDNYGLFDGIDNDNDGITDFEWRDLYDADGKLGKDGVFETRWYDFDEANSNTLTNPEEINRKMLSKAGTYILPASLPNSKFDKDAVLIVEPDIYKNLSSVIKHDEPTEHTITEQIKSINTSALPVDGVRYVAFQVESKPMPDYPEANPVSDKVDVEAILKNINTDKYQVPGKLFKINYPNLFDVSNDKQLIANLDQTAWKIAAAYGSYKLIGKDPVDCSNAKAPGFSLVTCTKIHDKILNDYLKPVVINDIDSPPSGFNLDRASTLKIADSLEWKNLSIDDKHEYVFSHYLNPNKNAFVGDASVLPAQAGENVKYGYEAAYLYLDGDKDGFNLNFNKDIKEETDISFDPFDQAIKNESKLNSQPSVEDSDAYAPNSQEYEFVNLKDFFKETQAFISYFTSKPNLAEACSAAAEITGKEYETPEKINYNNVISSSNSKQKVEINFASEVSKFVANGESILEVEANILNNGSLDRSGKTVKFSIVDMSTPGLVSLVGGNEASSIEGVAKKKIKAGKKSGSFKLRAEVDGYTLAEKYINLLAGAPVAIEIENNTGGLLANGESKTTLTINLKDKYGNLAEGSYYQIGIFANEKVTIPETFDVDGEIIGTQIDVLEGRANVDLYSKKESGEANIIAVLMDYDLKEEFLINKNKLDKIDFGKYVGASKKIKIAKEADLILSFDQQQIEAGSNFKPKLTATMLLDGKINQEYKENFEFKILTPNLAEIIGSKNNIASLQVATTSGEAEVLVNVPGFVSKITKLKIVASKPERIKLSASDEVISPDKNVILNASTEDQYGNLVDRDDVLINFSATNATESLVSFTGAKSAVSLNGVASVIAKAGDKSGIVNLIASANGLEDGVLSLKVAKAVQASDLKSYNIRALYTSILGGNFGADNVNMAKSILYSGTVNTVSAFTAYKSHKQLFRVDADGEFETLGDNISVETEDDRSIFIDNFSGEKLAETFVVLNNGEKKFVDQNGKPLSVKVLSSNVSQSKYAPGVYVKILTNKKNFVTQKSYSGISDQAPFGILMIDKESELQTEMEPFGIDENMGAGFKGQDKHMLNFAAGNTVGESVMAYASDASIIYGDPNVHLKVEGIVGLVSKLSGFSKDIGKPLFIGENEIREMLTTDYNGDGRDDVLLLYEDGYVRLLMNVVGPKKFKDMGYVLKVTNGILSATSIDTNNDGYDDLVIGTKESCKVKEACVSLFENNKGHFERKSLNLLIEGKVFEMKAADMNNNGCQDLVVSDSAGNLRVFYNKEDGKKCSGLNTSFGDNNNWNFGYLLNTKINLRDNLYLSYAGQDNKPKNYLDIALNAVDDPVRFIYASEVPFYSGLNKTALDVNGGSVSLGDEIDYIITINSKSKLDNLMISDLTPTTMQIVPGSLQCLDAGCSDKLQFSQTDYSLRSVIIKGASVPANGKRTIKYKMKVTEIPQVSFDLAKNFKSTDKDDYYDIRVRPGINPDGILTYLYSTGLNKKGQVIFKMEEVTSDGKSLSDLYSAEAKKQGVPDPTKDPQSAISKWQNSGNEDSDFDGCVDSIDKTDNSLSNVAESISSGIQNLTSTFRCSGGGCLPIPFNDALFAPDVDNPNGIATLAFGTPNPPYFAPFYSSLAPSTSRLYISPTLTLGLGTAICTGPNSTAGICYAFAIPPKLVGGCPKFLNSIGTALTKAKNVTSNLDVGLSTIVSDGNTSADSKAIKGDSAFTSANSAVSANAKVNVRIPGFPSVITNWLDAQTEEIYNKLLDLPDFYFIYPDLNTLVSKSTKDKNSNQEIKSINDFLKSLNSSPLIQIEGKEVLLKIPAISQGEIQKWQRQADLWITYQEDQIKRLDEILKCKESQYRESMCDLIKVKLGNLVANVKITSGKLDAIGRLPGEILKWRQMEAKYATQLICYMDAATQYTGGYINKQQKTVQSWMKAAEDAVRTFKNWKVLLDISADYQASCDECKNDRFSKLGLLLSVFASLPTDLPVIPLPKWPDIVFDISQIKTGVRVVWPDLVFRPEPVALFDLPTINISPNLPESVDINAGDLEILNAKLDGLPEIPKWIMEFPEISLPNFPDLPALPLPDLPDLPRPPKIPNIGSTTAKVAKNLKPAMQALCLLKKGLVPVPESSLGTEIETLTQPTVQATLPFMKDLGVQMPAIQYDYLKQIRINAKTNMSVETDFIYNAVKNGADTVNKKVDNFVDGLEEYTDFPFQQILDSAFDGIKKEKNDLQSYIDNMDKEVVPDKYYLSATQSFLDKNDPILNRPLSSIKKDIALRNETEKNANSKLRDSLIAYVDNLNTTNGVLKNISDPLEFGKLLVETDESPRKFASNSSPVTGEITERKLSFLGEGIENTIKASSESKLIAANFDSKDFADAASNDVETPRGFFVVVGNENESILNYVDELSEKVNSVFSDVDKDGDTDIVYSMGGNVYLKENYKENKKAKKGDLLIEVKKNTVSDFVAAGGIAVQGVSVPYDNYKKAQISWLSEKDKKYEVVLRNSLLEDFDKAFKVIASTEDSVDLDLENGNYYANVFEISKDGEKSLVSSTVMVAPQICGDKDAPLPTLSTTEYKVPLFGNLEIDASKAIDPTGEVKEYYLDFGGKQYWSDLNLAYDENGDGISWNDKTNPKFKIGPFDKQEYIGKNKATVHVIDQSGNSSSQEISIEIFVPKITLDESFSRSGIASGSINEKIADIPLKLIRNRYIYRVQNGKLSLVPRIEKVRTDKTNNIGEYRISDLDTNDMILVENSLGTVIAEINPLTGNFKITKDGYTSNIRPAQPLKAASYSSIVDSSGLELVKIYLMADINAGVSLVENKNSVSVKSIGKLKWQKFGSDNKLYPGGALLADGKKNLVIVDGSGNLIKLDSTINFRKKSNNHNIAPFVVEVIQGKEILAEVNIVVNKRAEIVGPNDVPVSLPSKIVEEKNISYSSPFIDIKNVNSELQNAAKILSEKGIIEGVPTANGIALQVNDTVDRAQFVKVLLDMLCIVPRKDAYENPSLFNDINDKNLWYYSYIKEAALRGLVNGYKGEVDEKGLTPYKPSNTITRAEAAKIILEALEMQGVLDLGEIQLEAPWYKPYIKISQDLTKYLKANSGVKNNFILTPEEALNPDALITRGDMMMMALRVLDFYDCSENNNENTTDEKVSDDTIDLNGNVSDVVGDKGIYVVPGECNTCPCVSTLSNKAEVTAGDIFFSVISTPDESSIFSKSNDILIGNVK